MNEKRYTEHQRELLWQQVRDQMAQAGYTADQTRWLVGRAITPMQYHEGPRINTKVGDDGLHVAFPYRERLQQCVTRYIAMSDTDRNTLHAGVEDGVRWRGEPITVYIAVVDETLRMREIGAEAYRAQCRASLDAMGLGKARRNSVDSRRANT